MSKTRKDECLEKCKRYNLQIEPFVESVMKSRPASLGEKWDRVAREIEAYMDAELAHARDSYERI